MEALVGEVGSGVAGDAVGFPAEELQAGLLVRSEGAAVAEVEIKPARLALPVVRNTEVSYLCSSVFICGQEKSCI